MTIFDDLEAEQQRLAGILGALSEEQWRSPSAAAGWTVADVVLHLARSEEAVAASVAGGPAGPGLIPRSAGATTDEVAEQAVRAQRAEGSRPRRCDAS
jgi:uncharacterized protein (TIGR03083 family)